MMNVLDTLTKSVPISNLAWRTSLFVESKDVRRTPRSLCVSSPTLADYHTPPYYSFIYTKIDGFWNVNRTSAVEIKSEPSDSDIGLSKEMTWRD